MHICIPIIICIILQLFSEKENVHVMLIFQGKEVFIGNANTTMLFCWMGDQSVSNSIQKFPSFHHQHWNRDMPLTSRLYQIYVHS